jgi:hypothetical protein
MGKRTWLATICVLALPFLYSASPGELGKIPAPFAVVALAGHTVAGGAWCDCDPVDGVCPCCGGNGDDTRITESPSDSANSLTKRHASNSPARGSRGDLDFGSGALWLGLGLLLWRYVRTSIF